MVEGEEMAEKKYFGEGDGEQDYSTSTMSGIF